MQYLLCQFLFMTLVVLSSSHGISHSGPDYYTAAMFEHARLGSLSDPPEEVLRRNLDMFQRAAELAATKGADIIVFPEYGLSIPNNRTSVKPYLEQTPDPREVSVNPCEQEDEFSDRPVLYTLSCMAKENGMVVVANTGDIQPCVQGNNRQCPDDGVYHYNTLVAFDRSGTLISRYYKKYLYYEFFMDLPQEPQEPIFETDFGTFAMFICFDYVFKEIVQAAQKVDNIILSTMWLNRMPLSNSVQFFEAWALGNNVTYLASNINIPGYGAVGSGMFSGRFGAIKYTNNPDGRSKLVVSRVPKSKYEAGPFPNPDASITVVTENGTEEFDEEWKDVPLQCAYEILGFAEDITKDYRCVLESMANYTLVKLTKLSDNLEACNDGMCCSLSYAASSMDESYYFGILNGTKNLTNRYSWCEENCLVVRCDPVNGTECVDFPLKSNTVFNRIEIKANFTTEYVYPSVVQNSLRLAPKNLWNHYVRKENDKIEGCLKYESSSQKPLLVAALNGRCYDRDLLYEM